MQALVVNIHNRKATIIISWTRIHREYCELSLNDIILLIY